MSQAKGEPLRWAVSVTVRTKTGLLRDYTSYHTNDAREDAIRDAREAVQAKLRPSASQVSVVSWSCREGRSWTGPDPTIKREDL
jgi:hypothetical protein